jgi:hypothetical protein
MPMSIGCVNALVRGTNRSAGGHGHVRAGVTSQGLRRGAPWRGQAGLRIVARTATGGRNIQLPVRQARRRLPRVSVLRCIAALLHFVATRKDGSGKAFDGQ